MIMTEPISRGLYMLLVDLVWTSLGMAVFLGTWYCVKRRHNRSEESNPHLEGAVYPQPECTQVKHEVWPWVVEDDLEISSQEMVPWPLPMERVFKTIGCSLWEEAVGTVAILLQQQAEEFEQNRHCQSAGSTSVDDLNGCPEREFEPREDSEGCNRITHMSDSCRMKDVRSDYDLPLKDTPGSEERCLQKGTSTAGDNRQYPAPTQPEDAVSGTNGDNSSHDSIPLKNQSSLYAADSQSVVSTRSRSPDARFEDVWITVSSCHMIELEFLKDGDTIWK